MLITCFIFCCRENNQVLGAYLTIKGVRKEDLGPYECRVSNAGDQAILLKLWLREAGKLLLLKYTRFVFIVMYLFKNTCIYVRFGTQLPFFSLYFARTYRTTWL